MLNDHENLKCYIVAGPNGSGKTTFAQEFLPSLFYRRFEKSWTNFQKIYKPLADSWIVFNTSGEYPVIIDSSEGKIG